MHFFDGQHRLLSVACEPWRLMLRLIEQIVEGNVEGLRCKALCQTHAACRIEFFLDFCQPRNHGLRQSEDHRIAIKLPEAPIRADLQRQSLAGAQSSALREAIPHECRSVAILLQGFQHIPSPSHFTRCNRSLPGSSKYTTRNAVCRSKPMVMTVLSFRCGYSFLQYCANCPSPMALAPSKASVAT